MRRILLGFLILTITTVDTAFASSSWPNEPTGSTTILDWPFTTVVGQGLVDEYNSGVVGPDPAGQYPLSPSGVLQQCAIPGNDTGGARIWLAVNTPEIYVGLWFKKDYATVPNNFNKVGFIVGPSNAYYMGYGGGWGVEFDLQEPSLNNCHIPGVWGDTYCNIFPGVTYSLNSNVWYRLEWHLKRSTSTTSRDGTIEAWITPAGGAPVKILNYVNIVNNGPANFNQVQLTTTWTGLRAIGWPTVKSCQYIDHLYVSTRGGGTSAIPPVAPTGLKVF